MAPFPTFKAVSTGLTSATQNSSGLQSETTHRASDAVFAGMRAAQPGRLERSWGRRHTSITVQWQDVSDFLTPATGSMEVTRLKSHARSRSSRCLCCNLLHSRPKSGAERAQGRADRAGQGHGVVPDIVAGVAALQAHPPRTTTALFACTAARVRSLTSLHRTGQRGNVVVCPQVRQPTESTIICFGSQLGRAPSLAPASHH
jgi:hypothetical protein